RTARRIVLVPGIARWTGHRVGILRRHGLPDGHGARGAQLRHARGIEKTGRRPAQRRTASRRHALDVYDVLDTEQHAFQWTLQPAWRVGPTVVGDVNKCLDIRVTAG